MKRLLIAFVVAFPVAAFAGSTQRAVLVGTTHRAPLAVRSLANEVGVDPTLRGHNYVEFSVVDGFAAQLTDDEIAALQRSSHVRFIEDDKPRHAMALPPRANASTLAQVTPYGVSLVHAPQAWVGGRGASINVAVLDTGVDYNHPDLSDRYAGGYNVLTGTTDPMDDNIHGTHCSGIIAASDNAIGVVGNAPLSKLWAIKVLDKKGSGTAANIIAGVNKVIDLKSQLGGNWIMSLSLGSCSSSRLEQEAFTAASAAGIITVAASGNHDTTKADQCTADVDNSYSVDFPAAYPGVIAVAAVNSAMHVADFSNFGPEVSLAAPGVDVLSTVPTGMGQFSIVTTGANSKVLAPPLYGSPTRDVTAPYVFCNLGKTGDFPASVAGKIALIKRGDITFHDKAQNAKKAGAVGVIIFNKEDAINGGVQQSSAISWTLIGQVGGQDDPADLAFDWPPTVGIDLVDGQALVNSASSSPVAINFFSNDDYEVLSGTSMACPHVAGVAAAVWSMAPNVTADQVRQILTATSHDLGDAGPDSYYGFGLIDAEAAGKQIAPQLFGPVSPPPKSGRPPGRRGH